MTPSNRADNLALLLGVRVDDATPKTSSEYQIAWKASPINDVTSDDAPFLLVHGDADKTQSLLTTRT